MKQLLLIAVMTMFLVGCGQADKVASILTHKPATTNGTTVLIFPEWKTSDSAFERRVYTNYFAVYSNEEWVVMEQQDNGTLSKFFKGDTHNETMDDVKMSFGLNIQWHIYRAMYDALSSTNNGGAK